jgi:hypothetical protein
MLKVNELRIGSLLDNGYNIVHVTSISLDIDDEYNPVIGVCRHGEHRNEVIIAEAAFGIEVKAIPLTPEWMERCGFSPYTGGTTDDNKFYIQVGNNLYLNFYVRSENWCVEPEGWSNEQTCWLQPKYLHQLQNLYFALSGEELKIEL